MVRMLGAGVTDEDAVVGALEGPVGVVSALWETSLGYQRGIRSGANELWSHFCPNSSHQLKD